MSLSLKVVLGVFIFFLALFTFLGFLGQAQLEELTFTQTLSDISVNSSSDIGITDLPSFLDGLIFSIDGLPFWLSFLLGLIPSVMLALGVIWLIRGV